MSEKTLRQKIVHWGQQEERVRQIVMTGDRVNRAAVKRALLPYEWIVSFSFEELPFQPDWKALFGEACLNLAQRVCDAGETQVFLLLQDRSRLRLRVVSQQRMDEILAEDSLCEVILDKDARYGARPRPTDLSRRVQKPTAEEFDQWCAFYFVHIVDAAFAAADQLPIPALCALDRARSFLLQMTEAAIASQSDFSVNLGADGANLRAYADAAWYDHFERTYVSATISSIWDGIFQACMLFRKAGLQLAEKCGYAYPKKEDVAILQMLRATWEEKNL